MDASDLPPIISASRRTDIPAYYMPWFMGRLRAGFALVPNPRNPRQVARVPLGPSEIAGIVFWTKDARPLLRHVPSLERLGVPYYVQYTITAYPKDLEPRSPTWQQAVDTFQRLSDLLGPQRVVWRYDPIIITDVLDLDYHRGMVERTAQALAGASYTMVLSFLDLYRKTKRNLRASASPVLQGLLGEPLETTMRSFASELAACARAYGFAVRMCAEGLDLVDLGVGRGRCVDPSLLGLGASGEAYGKDPGQRLSCGCVRSKDIGMYDSCPRGCVFCYANTDPATALRNRRRLHRVGGRTLLEGAWCA